MDRQEEREKMTKTATVSKKKSEIRQNIWLYIFLIPGLLCLLVFCYFPMYGIIMAFQDFNPIAGIQGSKFVGLKNFIILFQSDNFKKIFVNSLWISLLRLLWGFPAPIIIAVIMAEIRAPRFCKFSQTVLYMPHFISWVVLGGMLTNLLSPANGIINKAIEALGGNSIAFLQSTKYFRSILVASDIWKEAGWGAIVYIAAISGIDMEMFEAAKIDGATLLQKIRYITLPSISGTIITLLILRMGSVLKNGFEQIYVLYNPLVYDVADVFETYTYRIGMGKGQFGFATAVGLFQSVVGLILVLVTNYLARKYSEKGLW